MLDCATGTICLTSELAKAASTELLRSKKSRSGRYFAPLRRTGCPVAKRELTPILAAFAQPRVRTGKPHRSTAQPAIRVEGEFLRMESRVVSQPMYPLLGLWPATTMKGASNWRTLVARCYRGEVADVQGVPRFVVGYVSCPVPQAYKNAAGLPLALRMPRRYANRPFRPANSDFV